MSRLEVNMDNLPEIQHFAEDEEAELVIKAAEVIAIKSKPGEVQIHLTLSPFGKPEIEDIHHYVPYPSEAMRIATPVEYRKKIDRLVNLCNAFGYNVSSGIETEELVGLKGWALMGVQSDEQYGVRNIIKKFV